MEKGLGAAAAQRSQMLQLLLPHNSSHSVPVPSTSANPHIRMTLENKELWRKFLTLGTEMIITKSGRSLYRLVSYRCSFFPFILPFIIGLLSLFNMLCAQAHWVGSNRSLWVAPIASAHSRRTCTRHVDSTYPGRSNQCSLFRSNRSQRMRCRNGLFRSLAFVLVLSVCSFKVYSLSTRGPHRFHILYWTVTRPCGRCGSI